MTFKKNLTEFSNIGFTKINNCLNDKFLLKINSLILSKIYNKKINKNKLLDCSEDFRKFFSKKKIVMICLVFKIKFIMSLINQIS